jgi:cell pole-organizing protein PopZ
MDMTEKNGQPSMEEILASIRRIVAEEPETQMPHAYTSAPVIDFRHNPITLNGDGVLDDASEFDLPAIFRSSSTPQPEKPGPLIGRLTDAIRNATSAQSEPKHQPETRLMSAIEEVQDRNGDASTNRFGGQSESYQALSSLKPARAESPAQESPKTEQKPATSQGWNFARSAPPTAAVNEEIKRVMSPFKDTHFLRMSGPAAETPDLEPVAVSPVTPVVEIHKPVPAPSPAPVAETPRTPDFGTIIPGHFNRPGSAPEATAAAQPSVFGQPSREAEATAPAIQLASRGGDQVHAAAPPTGTFDGLSLTPPPLTLVSSEASEAAAMTPPRLPDAQGDGTIEDTTAELLRPMLRQWLADNMPRMVEKALHIEVAESVKTGKKPTGL